MKYVTNKDYTFINSNLDRNIFKYIEGDWVDMSTGILYDSVSLKELGWVIIPDTQLQDPAN